MTLSDEARDRLADVVVLQPTKNAELAERWGLDGGSEVHQYLESELGDYYYRDEDSRIRATAEAAELVGVEPDEAGDSVVRVPPLQYRVAGVVPGPDERSRSVVAVLHALRDAGHDADVDAVRSALRSLADKGVVTVERQTVPTFRLAVAREDLDLELLDVDGDASDARDAETVEDLPDA